jgi:hypothetical protein
MTIDYFQTLDKEAIVTSALVVENDILILGHKPSAKVHFHKYNPHDERFNLGSRSCVKWRTRKVSAASRPEALARSKRQEPLLLL